MADTPARTPLLDLQGSQGVNAANPVTADLLQQILAATNANNAGQASQNNQPAVPPKPGKQGKDPRAVWSKEEEKFLAERKLEDADKERAAAKGHKKAGKMVSFTVSRCLYSCCFEADH